jgi:hypothetical protein
MKKRRSKSKSAVDRIAPISFDDSLRVNLYGRSGTGKTTFWSTFPKPILAVICSGCARPGELRSINTVANRKVVKQVALEKTDDVRELIDFQREEGQFKTVVLEHATGLQDLTLKEILGLEELPAQGSWGMAKQQEWGQCALQMKETLRALLGLECNVVIVAQEREFNVESEGDLIMPYVASALTPSVTGWLNPACDYIWQTFLRQKTEERQIRVGKKTIAKQQKVKGVDYCLRTGPDAVYTTKFRVPKGRTLPDVIVDPDYAKVNKLIQG